MTAQSILKSLLTLSLAVSLAGCGLAGSRNAGPADSHLEKAKRLIEQGNYEEAFLQLNQALAATPQDPNIHLNLGWLYLYTDNPSQAGHELAKLERLAPDLAETFHLRGALYQYQAKSRQDHEAAVRNFTEALQRNAKDHDTYFDLANSQIALGQYDSALDSLNTGFDYIPDKDLETQVNFQIASCTAYAKMQMFDEAVAECQQALKFTQSPASRQRIEEMIENMKLMNPNARGDNRADAISAEEAAIIDEAVAD